MGPGAWLSVPRSEGHYDKGLSHVTPPSLILLETYACDNRQRRKTVTLCHRAPRTFNFKHRPKKALFLYQSLYTS